MNIFEHEAKKFCRKKHIKFATPIDFKPTVNRKVVSVDDTQLEDTDILRLIFNTLSNEYSSYRFFFEDINNYTLSHVIDILMDLGFKTQFSAYNNGWVIKIELITWDFNMIDIQWE